MLGIRLLVGGLFILLPLIFMTVGGTTAWHQHHKLTTYKPVEAVVSNSSITVSRGRKSTSYRPVIWYGYKVDGQRHVCSDVAPVENSRGKSWAEEMLRRFPVGEPTTAYYDPEHPSDAFLLHEYTFTPYSLVLFPMVFMTLGLVLMFGGGWMRGVKPPAPPAVAGGQWFALTPRQSLWQKLRTWLIIMMLWYGVGLLAIGHYFTSAPSPYGAFAWIASIAYLALGLLPAWGWLHYFLLMRRTSDPEVMTSVNRFSPAASFDVRLVLPMHQPTTIESLRVGLICDKHIKETRGNKTQYSTKVDYQTWQTVLQDHHTAADETIQKSATFDVPADAPPSNFGDYPRYEWKIEVKAALKDSPDYRAEFMILVEGAPLAPPASS